MLFPILSQFIPLASRWAEGQESIILEKGRPLTPKQRRDARNAGVAHPERIRILVVGSIKPPQGFLLGHAAKLAKAYGPETAGCTFQYGIFIRKDCAGYRANRALYLHEFVHVGQYERYGSINAFLVDYLKECIDPGYPLGPLEKQADRTAGRIMREARSKVNRLLS